MAEARRVHVPRRAVLASLVLAVVGVAVSLYLTYEHFTQGATFACPDNGVVNCVKVTTSEQSRLFGVPVAVLGLGYFLGFLALSLPVAWRVERLLTVRMLLAATGLAMVGWLVWAEFAIIHAICLYCTVVHFVTAALFVVVVAGTVFARPEVSTDNGGGVEVASATTEFE